MSGEERNAGEIGESGFPRGTIWDRMYYNGLGAHISGVWDKEKRESVPLDQCVGRGLMTQARHDEIVEMERKDGRVWKRDPSERRGNWVLVPFDERVERGLMTQAEHDEYVEMKRREGLAWSPERRAWVPV